MLRTGCKSDVLRCGHTGYKFTRLQSQEFVRFRANKTNLMKRDKNGHPSRVMMIPKKSAGPITSFKIVFSSVLTRLSILNVEYDRLMKYVLQRTPSEPHFFKKKITKSHFCVFMVYSFRGD